MKFIPQKGLADMTALLSTCMLGDRVLTGRLEAFSCKRTGEDKRVARVVEEHIKSLSASNSPALHGAPSLDYLKDPHVRRLLTDFICTMNATFPDHDFSAVTPDHFKREVGHQLVMNKVNANLAEMVAEAPTVLERLWAAVNESIDLKDCEVWSYVPDNDGDPFSDGCLWSFNYLFFNKNMKRILYFTCVAKSKYAMQLEGMARGDDGMDSDAEEDSDSPMEEGTMTENYDMDESSGDEGVFGAVDLG